MDVHVGKNNLYALIPIVVPHHQSLGQHSGITHKIDEQQKEKEKEEDILKYKKSTYNLTWFYRSNKSCVRP